MHAQADVPVPDEDHGPDLRLAGHVCVWTVLGSQMRGITGSGMGAWTNPARTQVLMRCVICSLPSVTELAGHWTAEQLARRRG